MNRFKTVPEYIDSHPKAVQKLLKQMRSTVKKVLPQATERISYGIPTVYQGKNLVHYAAFTKHIGFYPGALATRTFKKEIAKYKSGRGSIQFPLDKPLPVALITKITKFRLRQFKATGR